MCPQKLPLQNPSLFRIRANPSGITTTPRPVTTTACIPCYDQPASCNDHFTSHHDQSKVCNDHSTSCNDQFMSHHEHSHPVTTRQGLSVPSNGYPSHASTNPSPTTTAPRRVPTTPYDDTSLHNKPTSHRYQRTPCNHTSTSHPDRYKPRIGHLTPCNDHYTSGHLASRQIPRLGMTNLRRVTTTPRNVTTNPSRIATTPRPVTSTSHHIPSRHFASRPINTMQRPTYVTQRPKPLRPRHLTP